MFRRHERWSAYSQDIASTSTLVIDTNGISPIITIRITNGTVKIMSLSKTDPIIGILYISYEPASINSSDCSNPVGIPLLNPLTDVNTTTIILNIDVAAITSSKVLNRLKLRNFVQSLARRANNMLSLANVNTKLATEINHITFANIRRLLFPPNLAFVLTISPPGDR